MRDFSGEDIFKLGASAAGSEFCEWVQVGTDLYVLHYMFASNKAKLFAKNFSKYSNIDALRISLPVFPSKTNLKLHNISVTP